MDKPFDSIVGRMSKNQLSLLRVLLTHPQRVLSTRELAKKSGVVEKRLGGVLSAMSRRRREGMSLIEPMGRDTAHGLRWRVNTRALTVVLAVKQVKLLLASYK